MIYNYKFNLVFFHLHVNGVNTTIKKRKEAADGEALDNLIKQHVIRKLHLHISNILCTRAKQLDHTCILSEFHEYYLVR